MSGCEEYIDFVTKTIQKNIDHQYSIQGRNHDDPVGIFAGKKIEALKDLAKDLGVEVE